MRTMRRSTSVASYRGEPAARVVARSLGVAAVALAVALGLGTASPAYAQDEALAESEADAPVLVSEDLDAGVDASEDDALDVQVSEDAEPLDENDSADIQEGQDEAPEAEDESAGLEATADPSDEGPELTAQSTNSPVYEAGTTGVGLDGIDISRYQPDFASSGWTNYQFAIVKATEGTGYKSPTMAAQAAKVQSDGKLLGFYHYANGSAGAVAEADYFVDAVSPYIGKAVLALDWEGDAVSAGPAYAKAFLDRVYERTGVKPLIYMSHSVTTSHDWSSVANAGYGLWLAHYYWRYDNGWLASNPSSAESTYGYTEFLGYAQDPSVSGSMGAWSSKVIYQYSSTGKVGHSDGHLDIDKFYGTEADWISLATPDDPILVVDTWTLNSEELENQDVKLTSRVTFDQKMQFSKAGVRVWDSTGTLVVDHSEDTAVNNEYMNIWYELNGELGVTLRTGTTYTYQFWCVADGNTFTSETRSFTTSGPTQVTDSWSTWVESVTENNATLRAKVTLSQASQFSKAGLRLWDSTGALVVDHSEDTSVNLDYMNIWYDLNSELGVTLRSGDTYTYQFWCVADGKTFTSAKDNFTAGDGVQISDSWSTWEEDVTETNAVLHAKVTLSQSAQFTQAGIRVWDATGASVVDHSEAASVSLDYMNIWYDLNSELGVTLNPGMRYTYQFWCMANGQVFTSPKGSFGFDAPSTADLSGATVALPYASAPYTGKAITPSPTVTLDGTTLSEGTDYEVSYADNVSVGTATVTVTGVGSYEGVASASFGIVRAADGWYTFPDGSKGYGKSGKLVTGWLDLNGGKYWFDDQGRMATGWTDLVVDGKTMHYYFRPSGNLARGSWADIGGKKYYFRPSGNMATGWASIANDDGESRVYFFDGSGQMVTGWKDIVNDEGKTNHYYFRPSGSMATGWAQVDGESYYFRPSGNMATGFTDVTDDAYKRYFDESGRMLTGWQQINGQKYYFRASGAMQTGEATIDGKSYTFNDKGVLVG